ncbi:serine acetyltransferase [Cellulophaga baltica]|uniref:serine O-acetyltransferase n=1 Tax=Cellulophaga TaxID=104264 RepID=UPI001C06B770|nr:MULTISPECIES: serine acetyltransferase [Cellulophaga]MBU2996740.1 serine acetyltransferase [Cellulophaga baltica]MDO6768136.1 serine acetyltransferase [Cellulophaga sp. 1_MG-2023]
MIKSKKDLKLYIEADKNAKGIKNDSLKNRLILFLKPNLIWKFQKLLRTTEYYQNTNKNIFQKFYFYYLKHKYQKLSLKLGFSIPRNVFGPGLAIIHYGTIVVNSKARIGKNCRIHVCVNIGASGGKPEAPQIGDNVYIGPGAKIYGDIKIANNTAIAANASVGKSFLEENTVIGGVPAKKLKDFDIKTIIKHLK